MTVLDTNFLIDLLRNKAGISEAADSLKDPKTTAINAFELYYGARRSAKPEKAVLEVSNLLNSIDVLEFDHSAAQKAGDIHANLMNSGNPIDIMDVLIAGIVLANKEELMTRDIEHFDRIKGLRCRTRQGNFDTYRASLISIYRWQACRDFPLSMGVVQI
ncbi:MAG: type II toxin-antitoxin system VapC family toxin [Candidatus Methanoperedens sp.]|nr:type II toxin-antitoxin system VapC family toxin [Candidatus Methanoperedens sp.]